MVVEKLNIWFSIDTLLSPDNKIDHHGISEILLKVNNELHL
jgi:hypothetical protein